MNIMTLIVVGFVASLLFFLLDANNQKKLKAKKDAQKAEEEKKQIERIRQVVHDEFVCAGLALRELD